MNYYLAGPVDMATDRGIGWRAQLKELCKANNDIVFFDPAASFFLNRVRPGVAKYIHDVDMFALDHADAVVARMMKGDISIGTPIEIYRAQEHGKPLILMSDMDESIYVSYIGRRAVVVRDIHKLYGTILQLEAEAS